MNPLFHPFQFQYTCTYQDTQGDYVLLRAEQGPKHSEFFVPKNILPENIGIGDSFIMSIQPTESQAETNKKELACMQAMLQELLN